jgi:hypothetical protein
MIGAKKFSLPIIFNAAGFCFDAEPHVNRVLVGDVMRNAGDYICEREKTTSSTQQMPEDKNFHLGTRRDGEAK